MYFQFSRFWMNIQYTGNSFNWSVGHHHNFSWMHWMFLFRWNMLLNIYLAWKVACLFIMHFLSPNLRLTKGLFFFLTSWRIEIHSPSPRHSAMKEISHSLCKWSHNKWSVLPDRNLLQTSQRFSDTLSKFTPFLSAHSLLEFQTFLKLNHMNYLPQMTGLWASSPADDCSARSVSKLRLSLLLKHFILP